MAENMPDWTNHGGRLHLTFGDSMMCGGIQSKPNNLPCESCLQMLLELLDIAFTPAPEPAKAKPWHVA